MSELPRDLTLKEAIKIGLRIDNDNNIKNCYLNIVELETKKVISSKEQIQEIEEEQNKLLEYLNFYLKLV